MSRKPTDILEFLRRSSTEAPPEPVPALEPTPRMIVLRRTQVVVAAAAGALALVLVFLLGLALGGDGGEAGGDASGSVGVWVLRVISYNDDVRGQEYAQTVKSQLVKRNLGDEVNLRRSGDGRLVVTVGAWLQAPQDNPQARTLKEAVMKIQDRNGAALFEDAHFWLIRR